MATWPCCISSWYWLFFVVDAPKAYNVVVYLVCLYLACCLSRVQDRIDACNDCGLGTSHGNFLEVVECSSFSTFIKFLLGRPPKQMVLKPLLGVSTLTGFSVYAMTLSHQPILFTSCLIAGDNWSDWFTCTKKPLQMHFHCSVSKILCLCCISSGANSMPVYCSLFCIHVA